MSIILNCGINTLKNKIKNVLNCINTLKRCTDLEIGTKAKNIKTIQQVNGCVVPKTLIIDKNLFIKILAHNKINNPLNYNWSKIKIPKSNQKEIIDKIHDTFSDNSLVIRSSATCEDSPLLSFAGQYSSFLNIKGKKNIIKAIKLCYASLFSPNAIIYARQNGIKLEHESMAIAIQELIPVKIAGIIFTSDPVNQNTNKIIIEYSTGLGDAIVSGHKKPVRKKINKFKIPNYPQKLFLSNIIKIALKLESVFGGPQDIEWGWDGKKIYVFQSRNITTLKNNPVMLHCNFLEKNIIGRGEIVCKGISKGILRIIKTQKEYHRIQKGDIVMLKCNADCSIIKKIPLINGLVIHGGILSHISVIAREFNIPCLAEPQKFHKKISKFENKKVILDAIKGKIFLS